MIIKSLLDSDLYKFTMQYAVLSNFPNAYAKYDLFKRSNHQFPKGFDYALRKEIDQMATLQLYPEEKQFLINTCPFLDLPYLDFLQGYRFDPNEVSINQAKDGTLSVSVEGYWYRTILWEVPILALITELYYTMKPDDVAHDDYPEIYADLADYNISTINDANVDIKFADFGTRRRKSFRKHKLIVSDFAEKTSSFVGTSNVYLAYLNNIRPIGTFAHEWVSGIAALNGYAHPNYNAMEYWVKTYNGDLGIALTDTFGTNEFFNDFDKKYSKLFDGVRHDSGDPFLFADKVIAHYKSMGIDPTSKTIIFSDNITIDKAIEIQTYCDGRINVSFGIGTFLTNNPHFRKNESMNVVMKLTSIQRDINSKPHSVIKLSDEPGKETGNKNTVKLVKWYLGYA